MKTLVLSFGSMFSQSFAASAIGIILVLSMMLSLVGCSAAPTHVDAVYAIQPETTAKMILEYLSGSGTAKAFMKDNLVMIAKPIASGWAFVCLDCANSDPILNLVRTAGGRGNYVSSSTFSWLTGQLKEVGWSELKDVNKLPPSLLAWKEAAKYASTNAADVVLWINKAASSIISLAVVPAGMLEMPDGLVGSPIQY